MNNGITIKDISTTALLLFSLYIFQSCAKKNAFSTSQVVPAAEGSEKVKKDDYNIYNIDLRVMHLTDLKRLTPSKEMYIVWMETEQNGIKNIGQLNTASGLLTTTLKSSLKTVSTFKPTSFFITAQGNATASKSNSNANRFILMIDLNNRNHTGPIWL